MARESQGLQVLLIVFVMLSVVLGVSLYLYVKKADEVTKANVVAAAAKKTAEDATAEKQKECDELKTLIGSPGMTTEEIKTQYAKDMDAYRGETKLTEGKEQLFDAGSLYYHNLLAAMNQVIQDRTTLLLHARAEAADYERRFKIRESMKDGAIAAIMADHAVLTANMQKAGSVLGSALQATSQDSARLANQVKSVVTDANAAKARAEAALKAAEEEKQKAILQIAPIKEQLNQLNRKQVDLRAPSGEITWVSLPNKMVWINRGRADGLLRQTKFTVYSAESAAAAKAVEKGSVEVTAIDGDHSAQCRIVNDKLADPITAGDKVYTPLWSPGQQNHFALTGVMNLDGDGRNQVNVVRGMISEGGGVVDCWLDDDGHKHGQVTPQTTYLVLGDPPDGRPALMKGNTEIINDAGRYHVETLKLPDFKKQMNYQKASSMEHWGAGSSSNGNVGRASTAVPAPAPKPSATSTPATP
jgi:hypothetical protein